MGEWAQALIHSRCNVSPKRLVAPGPDAAQLERIVQAAAAAPDHGRLLPWRFILVPADKRALLAQAFVRALQERDATASAQQLESAHEKAFRAPVLLVAVVCLGEENSAAVAGADEAAAGTLVHDNERLVSLGCAIQNMLLSAHAEGWGSGLTSGQAMHSAALRELLALAAHEQAVCCVNLGTVSKHKGGTPRPLPATFFSSL